MGCLYFMDEQKDYSRNWNLDFEKVVIVIVEYRPGIFEEMNACLQVIVTHV